MARLALLFVALVAVVAVECAEIGLKSQPIVVESNFPSDLQLSATAYVQAAFETQTDLVSAAKLIKDNIQHYQNSEKWNVVINPGAYYVERYYFSRYLVDNKVVLVYSAPHCY